jgi:seryl-tRNA synthetase
LLVQVSVYKGKGANYNEHNHIFLDKNTEAGYLEYQVPHLVNEASVTELDITR